MKSKKIPQPGLQNNQEEAAKLLIAQGKTVISYWKQADQFRKKGRKSQAIECLRKIIEIKPNYPYAYTNLGIILREKGENTQAAEFFRKAIEVKSNDVFAYCNLVSIYLNKSQLTSSVQNCILCGSLSPQFPIPFFILGTLFHPKYKTLYQSTSELVKQVNKFIHKKKSKAINYNFKIYFNISLFYIFTNQPDSLDYLNKFIYAYQTQQSPNKQDQLQTFLNHFQKNQEYLFPTEIKEMLKKVNLMKLILYDKLNFKKKLQLNFDKLLSEHKQILSNQQPTFNKSIIEEIIQIYTRNFNQDKGEVTQGKFISYILKFLMIKFQENANIRQILMQKYHTLRVDGKITLTILKSTIMNYQVMNLKKIKHFYEQSQSTFKLLQSYNSPNFRSGGEQIQFFNSFMNKIQHIRLQQIDSKSSQDLLKYIIQSQVHINPSLSKTNNALEQNDIDDDSFLQLFHQIQGGNVQNDQKYQEEIINIVKRFQKRITCCQLDQKQKIQIQLTKNITNLKTKENIKLIIAKICENFTNQQYSFDQAVEKHLFKQFSGSNFKKNLIKQFIRKCIKYNNGQQMCLQYFKNILKAQICRQLVIQIHKNLNFFIIDDRNKKKFYELLGQVSQSYCKKEPINLQKRFTQLLAFELKSQTAQSIKALLKSQINTQSLNDNQAINLQKSDPKKKDTDNRNPQIDQDSKPNAQKNNYVQCKLAQSNQNRLNSQKPEIRPKIGLSQQEGAIHYQAGNTQGSLGQIFNKENFGIFKGFISFAFNPLNMLLQVPKLVQESSKQLKNSNLPQKRQQKSNKNKNEDEMSKVNQQISQKGILQKKLSEQNEMNQRECSFSQHHSSMSSNNKPDSKISASSSFKKSQKLCDLKAELLGAQTDDQKILMFQNHYNIIKYLSFFKTPLKWIAKYRFDQDNIQDNKSLYFRFSLTKGSSDFAAKGQKYTWYTDKLWSKGIEQVLWWIYCMISAIIQLQKNGIFHPDLQFRNTIRVKNKEDFKNFEHKYSVIDFDYAFKVFRQDGDHYPDSFIHTNKIITHFIKKESTSFIRPMFRDIDQCHKQYQLKISKKVISKDSQGKKRQSILHQLQKYSLFYHKKQLIKRIQQLIDYKNKQKQHEQKLNQIKKKLQNYQILSKEDLGYAKMRYDCETKLYDVLLAQLKKELE